MNDVERLVASDKIRKQLYLYCKGIDQRDWPLVRSCFAEEHQHRHPPFEGSVDEFIGFASMAMTIIPISNHSISNMIIDIDDDGQGAKTEAGFCAIHVIEEGADVGFLSFDLNGEESDWTVVGSYHDRWIFRDQKWLIVERDARHIWQRLEPSKSA